MGAAVGEGVAVGAAVGVGVGAGAAVGVGVGVVIGVEVGKGVGSLEHPTKIRIENNAAIKIATPPTSGSILYLYIECPLVTAKISTLLRF